MTITGIKYNGRYTDRTGLERLSPPLPGFTRDWLFEGLDGDDPATVKDLVAGALLTVVNTVVVDEGYLVTSGTGRADFPYAVIPQPFTRVFKGKVHDLAVSSIIFGSSVANMSAISIDSMGRFAGYASKWWYGPLADLNDHLIIFTTDGLGNGVLSVDDEEYPVGEGSHNANYSISGGRLGANSQLTDHTPISAARFAISPAYSDTAARAAIRTIARIPA